jgi:hypothetical protein
MPHRDHLSRRGKSAHYFRMLPLLFFVASCTAGDLTESSEPGTAVLEEAGGVLPVLERGRGNDDRKKEGQNRLAGVSLSPTSVTLEPGATQSFTATVKLSAGGTSDTWPVKWSATGGTIDHGLYTAHTPGVHRVIATSWYGTFADTAVVTVSGTAGTLVSLSVTPGSATLATGGTQRFAVSGKLRDGTITVPSVTWTVTGGTITSDGIYTAGSTGGTYRAVATHESKLTDTATITIAATGPAPTDPPTSAAGCPSSGYSRVVNVASSSALGSALNAAQPGDQIQLASGTYSGTVTISRRGTATDSITLCGPATAIVAGAVNVTDASYWRLQGFQVRDGWIGLQVRRSVRNRISGLEIHSVGYSGIKLTEGSSYNVVTGNWVHHTGKTAPQYGEGVYVGEGQSSATSAQRVADYNVIEGNRFGPYVTAEHFDVKLGTQGNIVRGNTHDATGFRLIWTNGLVAALGIVDGNNQRVEANTVANLTYSDPSNWGVFRTYAGSGTVVTRNVVVGPVSARRFYDRDHASSTVVKCDNLKPSALAWGTTCAP